jgi:glycosyltransferase involved in cell wall biosynthesis
MKKIGILAFAGNTAGGVYHYTQSLIDALALDESHRYVLFTLPGGSYTPAGMEVRHIAPQNPARRVLTKLCAYLGVRVPLLVLEGDRRLFTDIDFFVAPSFYLYPHTLLGKPYLITIHDLQERYYPQFFSLAERVERFLVYAATARHAAHIVCESRFVKNDIVNFLRIDPARISVIQSPPPRDLLGTALSAGELSAVRSKYNLPDRYLFYPAQFWLHKNHLRLVEAFRVIADRFPDVKLVLTGMKANDYHRVVAKIAELGLDDRVLHLGYIDYRDMAGIYKLSAMLVMPTLFESVSMPVYEAFALKVPVCASNVVALPEQIGDAGLLFDPTDPADMAEKIGMILSNEELALSLVSKGYERIRDFDHGAYAKKLADTLHSLAGC